MSGTFAEKRMIEVLEAMQLLDAGDHYALVHAQFDDWITAYEAAIAQHKLVVDEKSPIAPAALRARHAADPDFAAFDALAAVKQAGCAEPLRVSVPFIGDYITQRLTETRSLTPEQAETAVEMAAGFQAGARLANIGHALELGDAAALPYALKFDAVPNDRQVSDAKNPTARQFQATVSLAGFLAHAARAKPDLAPQIKAMGPALVELGRLQQRIALAQVASLGFGKEVKELTEVFGTVTSEEVEAVRERAALMQAALAQGAKQVFSHLAADEEAKKHLPEKLQDWLDTRTGQVGTPDVVAAKDMTPARSMLEKAWHGVWNGAKHAFFNVHEDGHIRGISPQGVITIGGLATVALGGLVRDPSADRGLGNMGKAVALAGVVDGIIRAQNVGQGGGVLDQMLRLAGSSAPAQPLPSAGAQKA